MTDLTDALERANEALRTIRATIAREENVWMRRQNDALRDLRVEGARAAQRVVDIEDRIANGEIAA